MPCSYLSPEAEGDLGPAGLGPVGQPEAFLQTSLAGTLMQANLALTLALTAALATLTPPTPSRDWIESITQRLY